MTNKKFWLGLVVLVFILAGCTTFQASGLQTGLNINGQRYEKLENFSEKMWTNKFPGWGVNGGTLFNLTSKTDPKVRDAIAKHRRTR